MTTTHPRTDILKSIYEKEREHSRLASDALSSFNDKEQAIKYYEYNSTIADLYTRLFNCLHYVNPDEPLSLDDINIKKPEHRDINEERKVIKNICELVVEAECCKIRDHQGGSYHTIKRKIDEIKSTLMPQ